MYFLHYCTVLMVFYRFFEQPHSSVLNWSTREGKELAFMSIMQLTQTIHILPTSQSRQDKYSAQPTLPGLEPEQDMAPMITNRQIAEALSSVAELLEFQDRKSTRLNSYRNAARGVLGLNEPA